MFRVNFLLVPLFFFIVSSLHTNAQVEELWKKSIKYSINHANKSVAMDLDKFGNCYITGIVWKPDSTKDILVMKFSPEGEELWRRVFDGPDNGDDIPMAMCLDQYDDVIIAGISKDSKGNGDICLVKFSNEGVLVFSQIFGGRDGLFDAPVAVTCDYLGNIIVGGYVTTNDSGLVYSVHRFFPDGSLSWSAQGGSRNMDIANALLTDDSCNVYMAGNHGVSMRLSDMIIQKYDSSGKRIWEYVYDGMLSMRDAAFHLAADDSMNLYVGGFLNHGSDRSDIPLLKFSRNGELLQQNLHFGGMTDCITEELFVDKTGAYLTATQHDYMRGTTSSLALHFDKSGEQKLLVKAEQGINFGKMVFLYSSPLILGNILLIDGNTRIPFVAEPDTTGELLWQFADSSIAGLLNMTDYRVRGDKLYFLGDDTGEANGSISLLCYRLMNPGTEKPKGSHSKSPKGAIRKN